MKDREHYAIRVLEKEIQKLEEEFNTVPLDDYTTHVEKSYELECAIDMLEEYYNGTSVFISSDEHKQTIKIKNGLEEITKMLTKGK